MSIPWYADAVSGVVIAGFVWLGVREFRTHSWAKADRHRRAVRARILFERAERDELARGIFLAQIRADLAISEAAAFCEKLALSRPVPPRIKTFMREAGIVPLAKAAR